jgi:hypothetical protein
MNLFIKAERQDIGVYMISPCSSETNIDSSFKYMNFPFIFVHKHSRGRAGIGIRQKKYPTVPQKIQEHIAIVITIYGIMPPVFC